MGRRLDESNACHQAPCHPPGAEEEEVAVLEEGKATMGAWAVNDMPIMNVNCIHCFSMNKRAILGSGN